MRARDDYKFGPKFDDGVCGPGLDMQSFAGDIMPPDDADTSRKAIKMNRIIGELQESFTVIERVRSRVLNSFKIEWLVG